MTTLATEPLASASLRDEPIDTTARLVTPERITFLYPIAGPFRRATAYLIDLAIWMAIVIGASIGINLFSAFSIDLTGLFFVVFFLLTWGYGAFFEAIFNGRTPGKMACGLRVVTSRGTPITGTQAFLRNITWPVEGSAASFLSLMLPTETIPTLFFLPAITSVVLTEKFQRLGDLAAGTMVIVETRSRSPKIIPITDPEVVRVAARLPARIDAGPDLSRALADYAALRDRLSRAQREEIAAPLARPLRRRYDLPDEFTADAVVSAMYQRIFLGQ